MKLLFLLFVSFFPVKITGTKCLQCSHSINSRNNLCINGKYKAEECPTAGNSCLISLKINSTRQDYNKISLLKFSRQCADEKKQDGFCQVLKNGTQICYCNGDGCNVIPAKALYEEDFEEPMKQKDVKVALTDTEALRRQSRQGGPNPPPSGTADVGDTCNATVLCKPGLVCEPNEENPAESDCKDNGVDGGDDDDNVPTVTQNPTPVIRWQGSQTWGTFENENGKECMNKSMLSKIVSSGDTPENKKKLLEENSCRLEYGLECVNISDTKANPVQYKFACRCMINLGPQPAVEPPPNTEQSHDSTRTQCYIPAGKGYASMCFDSNTFDKSKYPPYQGLGFPYPFGDPPGTGPDPPDLVDVNTNSKKEVAIEYIQWNTIFPRCVPNSECREGATYIGRRCQCFKNATLVKRTGICDTAIKLTVMSELLMVLLVTLVQSIIVSANCGSLEMFAIFP